MEEIFALGRELQPGDKVITNDGAVLIIQSLTPGLCRNSRLAHFENSSEWTTVFDNPKYEVQA
jgi:hypothetical protein